MVMVSESEIQDLKDEVQKLEPMARLAHLLSIMEGNIMTLQGQVFRLQDELGDEKRKNGWLEIQLEATTNSIKKYEEKAQEQ
jgi:hypothetical protein